MKKKFFLFAIPALILVAASLVLFHSCEGLDFGGGNGLKNGEFMYTDYDTDILLTGKTDNGDEVTIIGTKDSQGYPTSITGFQFKEKSSKKEGTLTFKGDKLVQAETGDGVTILFDWLNNGELAVTMVDQETGEEFKTSYKPEGKAATGFSSQQPSTRNGNTTLTVEKYATPEEVAITPEIGTKAAGTKATGNVKGYIKVQKCGYPDDDAQPYVSIYKDNGFGSYNVWVGDYFATRIGKGEYEYSFPGSEQPHHEINIAKYAGDIATFMGYVCGVSSGNEEYLTGFCPLVAAALGSTGIGLGAAGGFVAACATTIAGLKIYCSTFGAGVPGGDDIASVIAKKLDVKWDEPLVIVPFLNALPKSIKGKPFTYTSGNTISNASEFSSEEPTIAIFQLTPAAPSSGQSYDAKAALKCVPAGAKVTISIEGTDGYSNSKTETFDEAIYTTVVTLHVPGAAKGVRDVCKVVVELPNGDQMNKSASLVFGE